MAIITISRLGSSKPLYRIELRADDQEGSKPLLTRRFKEEHIALGLAITTGRMLGIDPDLTIRTGADDDDC